MTLYGDPESFYKSFLKFAARSKKVVEYQDNEYSIEHTQFAKYPIQELFTTMVDKLTVDITKLSHEEVGSQDNISQVQDELSTSLKETSAYITLEMRNMYHRREYIKEQTLNSAISDYMMAFGDKSEKQDSIIHPFTPRASTKYEALAEILTLVNSKKAYIGSDFSATGIEDEDDKSKPNPCSNTTEAFIGVQNTVISNHGFSVFSRPDPSLSTIREIFTIYEEIGMNPSVRDVYGIFVKDYEVRPSTREFINNRASTGGDLTRWTSEDEPPLTDLESYKD